MGRINEDLRQRCDRRFIYGEKFKGNIERATYLHYYTI